MKYKVILLIYVFIINIGLFGDELDDLIIFTTKSKIIADEVIYKYINRNYIYSINLNGNLSSLSIIIYFNAGVYTLSENINSIIENKILEELKENISINNISIISSYPYSIILLNNNYSFNEIQIIKNNINIYGIIIDQIFQNTIFGYFYDKHFGYFSEEYNNDLFNSFNVFLEEIIKYFGVGNIITFQWNWGTSPNKR